MWVRGLKHVQSGGDMHYYKSHPMWVRGLKLFEVVRITKEV